MGAKENATIRAPLDVDIPLLVIALGPLQQLERTTSRRTRDLIELHNTCKLESIAASIYILFKENVLVPGEQSKMQRDVVRLLQLEV